MADPILRMIHGKMRRVNGALTQDRGEKRLRLKDFITDRSKLPAPRPFDWSSIEGEWGIDGNDNQGDCVSADGSHATMVYSKEGFQAQVTPTTQDTLRNYHAVGGPGDNGLYPPDFLTFQTKHGLCSGDQPIKAFAEVAEPTPDHCLQVGEVFGPLSVSVNLPSNCFDEINAGKPWADTRMPPNRNMGHQICMVKADQSGPTYVTWGKLQQATWAWHEKYATNVYLRIHPFWVSGKVPGVDVAGLIEAFKEISGQDPPPIDPPLPPIPPTPPAPPLSFWQRIMAWLESLITHVPMSSGLLFVPEPEHFGAIAADYGLNETATLESINIQGLIAWMKALLAKYGPSVAPTITAWIATLAVPPVVKSVLLMLLAMLSHQLPPAPPVVPA